MSNSSVYDIFVALSESYDSNLDPAAIATKFKSKKTDALDFTNSERKALEAVSYTHLTLPTNSGV